MKALHDFGQIASGTSPRLDNLACVDCMFRDRSIISIDGVEKQVGVTKAFCEIFVKPNSKPHDVLFEGVDCEFKEAEV